MRWAGHVARVWREAKSTQDFQRETWEKKYLETPQHRRQEIVTREAQCTYNVTLRDVRVTTVAVGNNKKVFLFWVCVSGLRYPACKCSCAMLSSVACPALQYLSTLSHKSCDFWKVKYYWTQSDLIFSTTFVWNISHSKTNRARYDQKRISVGMYSAGYYC